MLLAIYLSASNLRRRERFAPSLCGLTRESPPHQSNRERLRSLGASQRGRGGPSHDQGGRPIISAAPSVGSAIRRTAARGSPR
jgi:hypothetical protein